jgi:hypothetical protein
VAHRLLAGRCGRTAAEKAAAIVIRHAPTMSIDQLNLTAHAVLKTEAEQQRRATAADEQALALLMRRDRDDAD